MRIKRRILIDAEMKELKIRWRYGILIGVFLALLSLYPQIYLKYQRGENYNGATFFYDFDEQAYESYLQALIDGKPRKNDVYSGIPPPPSDETLLSIQVLPAYSVAQPARWLGISAETTFLFVSVFSAFLTSIVLFWLIANVCESSKPAAVGTLFVLVFGAFEIYPPGSLFAAAGIAASRGDERI